MLGVFSKAASRITGKRSFSTSSIRASDVCKLTLVGTLVKTPEARMTKQAKSYVVYTVATNNFPPPPRDANGERRPATSSYHRILSFHENTNHYLQNYKKGARVYVEANLEMRDAEPGADPSTPQGQRQIFLRHESIRVLWSPKETQSEENSEVEVSQD